MRRDDAQALEEVRRAEDMARRLDDWFGRAFVNPDLAARHEAIAEAAAERAAITHESAPTRSAPGLVSTPTSDTRCFEPSSITLATRALLAAVAAVPLDPIRKRLHDLRKIIGASARGHMSAANPGGDDTLMLTLTYADGVEWQPGHITGLVKAMREWFRRRGERFRYVWVGELQPGRGVLHYHVALFVPRGFKVPFADDRGWWPHGMTRTELARDAVAYLMSYLGKEDQKDFARFPKGARAYGVGGLEEAFKRVNRWLRAPTFVRRLSSINDGWKRAPAGGVMVDQGTGQVAGHLGPHKPVGRLVELHGGWIAPGGRHFVSEFRRVMVAGVAAVRRVATHCMEGAMPEGVGPFSWISHAKGST